LITASLLLCLAFAALWHWGDGTDRARTWQSGRRTFQVASWDGRLEYRVVHWLDDKHAQRGTTLLARRSGFAYQPGVEQMQSQLTQQRDSLVAASGNSAAPAPPRTPARRSGAGPGADAMTMASMVLANLSNTLITDHPPLKRSFAGVTVERQTCRLPVTDDAGQTVFDPPVPVLSVYAACWVPVVLFGALPAFTLLRAAGRNFVQRRRLKHHRCPACGYDLRATPGNCPECGQEIPNPNAQPAPAPAHNQPPV
jgi:hypothetical protein